MKADLKADMKGAPRLPESASPGELRAWATSSFGDSAGTRPADLEALREHLTQCSDSNGHMVGLQIGWLRLRGFMASRLVTTMAVVALGVTAALLLLS